MDLIVYVKLVAIRKRGDGMEQKIKCRKCGLLLSKQDFYNSNRVSYLKECKNCLTKNIDPYNYQEIMRLCMLLDIPFIQTIWEKTLNQLYQHFNEITCKIAFSRYVAKMKLYSFKYYHYKDSQIINTKG